jgi:hypothetical protein
MAYNDGDKNTNPGNVDYSRQPSTGGQNHSTGWKSPNDRYPNVNKTGGRSSGQDVQGQDTSGGGSNVVNDGYPSMMSLPSEEGMKTANPEVPGGTVPRGYVLNNEQPKGQIQDVGSLRPNGGPARLTFHANIFAGWGTEAEAGAQDPRTGPGGRSQTGPGGAGV